MNNSQITATKERLDLLSEIEQTPEEYIEPIWDLFETAIAFNGKLASCSCQETQSLIGEKCHTQVV